MIPQLGERTPGEPLPSGGPGPPAAQDLQPPPWIPRGGGGGGGEDSPAAHPHPIFFFLYLIVAIAVYGSAPLPQHGAGSRHCHSAGAAPAAARGFCLILSAQPVQRRVEEARTAAAAGPPPSIPTLGGCMQIEERSLGAGLALLIPT